MLGWATWLALVGLVAGQSQCDGELSAFESCLEEARPPRPEPPEEIAQCLVQNGCEDPRAAREEAKACKEDVIREQVAPELESCAGFRLPDGLLDKLGHGGHHGAHHGSGGKGKGGWGGRGGRGGPGGRGGRGGRGGERREDRWSEALGRHCPSEEAASAAGDCLKAAWESRRAEGFGGRDRPRPDFGAFQRCQEQLSEECASELERRQEVLCNCGEELAADEALVARLNAALQACRPEDSSEESSEEEEPGRKGLGLFKKLCRGPPHGSRGGRGGPGKRGLWRQGGDRRGPGGRGGRGGGKN